eukprot:scaffold77691_cov30-Tisochrysis_lutea.AAC.1
MTELSRKRDPVCRHADLLEPKRTKPIQIGHQLNQVRPHRRLSARQPDLLDSSAHKDRCELDCLIRREERSRGRESHSLCRHTVATAQRAPLCEREAEVGVRATER